METYTSLNDPKLNELIDTLVELRNLHQELDDEHRDLAYKMGDFYDYIGDEDFDEDLYYEYEDQQASLQDDMYKTEEDMKRLIAEYASLNLMV